MYFFRLDLTAHPRPFLVAHDHPVDYPAALRVHAMPHRKGHTPPVAATQDTFEHERHLDGLIRNLESRSGAELDGPETLGRRKKSPLHALLRIKRLHTQNCK